jgi:CRISPR-associated endonuclease/helicase Cas3
VGWATPTDFFCEGFAALLGGRYPYPWQRTLFNRLVAGDIPEQCSVPTGLGKTAVIHAWVLALAWQAMARTVTLPRRLVYIVDRRTVVDQATAEAERLSNALRNRATPVVGSFAEALDALRTRLGNGNADSPLAVSTLRGQFADNGAWRVDPARPAVIVGTVDMVGSKLLFSGYGDGRALRSLHAGLLGHDVLYVLDETHLAPAFAAAVRQVVALHRRQPGALRPFALLEMTATPVTISNKVVALEEEDYRSEAIKLRLDADKRLRIRRTSGPVGDAMAERALAFEGSGRSVLVYVNSPADAARIAQEIRKKAGPERVAVLTGNMRGRERDRLAAEPTFRRFLPSEEPRAQSDATAYLVSTSAGEVGVDLDADAAVFELATADALVQRLGRVNRAGGRVATIELVAQQEPNDERLNATLQLLAELPKADGDSQQASPAAMARVVQHPRFFSASRELPRTRPLEPYLLDTWSLTGLDEPCRQPVAPWLHGVDLSEPPEAWFVWRCDIPPLRFQRRWLAAFPVLTREMARLSFGAKLGPARFLKALAERKGGAGTERSDGAERMAAEGVLLCADGAVERVPLDRPDEWSSRLAYSVVILPCVWGGLREGIPDDEAAGVVVPDVAEGDGERERWRIDVVDGSSRARRLNGGAEALGLRLDAGSSSDAVAALALARGMSVALVIPGEEGEEEPSAVTVYLVAKTPRLPDDEDLSSVGYRVQRLDDHLSRVGDAARALACALALPEDLVEALGLAGELHDRGKDRPWWQRAVGNRSNEPYAKYFVGRPDWRINNHYRHEFGSLLEAREGHRLDSHPHRDLILHLVAAHHGYARPGFPDRAFDRGFPLDANRAAAAEAQLRFDRLQRRYGWWTLAYLEALLKAADVMGSREDR